MTGATLMGAGVTHKGGKRHQITMQGGGERHQFVTLSGAPMGFEAKATSKWSRSPSKLCPYLQGR